MSSTGGAQPSGLRRIAQGPPDERGKNRIFGSLGASNRPEVIVDSKKDALRFDDLDR
jgi:hypothetical protein